MRDDRIAVRPPEVGGPAACRRRGFCLPAHLTIETECAMRLSSARVERTLSQVPAQAIPENHPVVPQLSKIFGDHTFFVDNSGLLIVEPAESPGAPQGQVIKLATWSDANRTSLAPHEPEATDVVVVLGADGPDSVN